MKNCTRKSCKQENPQPLENFYKDTNKKDKLDTWCKDCKKEYRESKDSKVRIKNYSKKYYEKPGIAESQKNKNKVYLQQPNIKEYRKQYKKDYNQKPEVKNRRLIKSYGITLEEYTTMLLQQNYKCSICKTEQNNVGNRNGLFVDHIHVEGYNVLSAKQKREYIRGLICNSCNIILGVSKDNPDVLYGCIEYLKKHGDK